MATENKDKIESLQVIKESIITDSSKIQNIFNQTTI